MIWISNQSSKNELMNTNEISFYSLDGYGLLLVFLVFRIINIHYSKTNLEYLNFLVDESFCK